MEITRNERQQQRTQTVGDLITMIIINYYDYKLNVFFYERVICELLKEMVS